VTNSRPSEPIITLIDSNVLLDIATEDPRWADWSDANVAQARDDGTVVINPIIYAEVSVGYESIESLDDALPASDFKREALPFAAGFLAGKAFLVYRQRGGARSSPIADFYVGAHAATKRYRLLTRDPSRYRTYFPSVELIAPDSSPSSARPNP